jgi:hypothetical protein
VRAATINEISPRPLEATQKPACFLVVDSGRDGFQFDPTGNWRAAVRALAFVNGIRKDYHLGYPEPIG